MRQEMKAPLDTSNHRNPKRLERNPEENLRREGWTGGSWWPGVTEEARVLGGALRIFLEI